jgi:hypothetical protein
VGYDNDVSAYNDVCKDHGPRCSHVGCNRNDHDDKQYGNGRQETHWQPTVVVVIKPTTTRTHFCQPTLLLSTKTNMANTTFNDENTFCPTVPRKKGKADLLSTKTNMTNTTFNDENIFMMRTRVAIAREIY